jgi:hypothetical protein
VTLRRTQPMAPARPCPEPLVGSLVSAVPALRAEVVCVIRGRTPSTRHETDGDDSRRNSRSWRLLRGHS